MGREWYWTVSDKWYGWEYPVLWMGNGGDESLTWVLRRRPWIVTFVTLYPLSLASNFKVKNYDSFFSRVWPKLHWIQEESFCGLLYNSNPLHFKRLSLPVIDVSVSTFLRHLYQEIYEQWWVPVNSIFINVGCSNHVGQILYDGVDYNTLDH